VREVNLAHCVVKRPLGKVQIVLADIEVLNIGNGSSKDDFTGTIDITYVAKEIKFK
jgi:hypothetical protein